MGQLQGIRLTPELRSLVDTVLALPQPAGSAQQPSNKNDKSDSSDSSSSSPPLTSSPRSASASSPSALLQQVQEAKRALSSSSITTYGARGVVEKAIGNADESNDKKAPSKASAAATILPLAAIPSLKHLIMNSTSQHNKKSHLLQQLESNLRQTTLSFTPKPAPKQSNPEYTKRLERLRLQDEERSYSNLTTNLKTAASLKDDNVTAKSMMYATSVGLNMVVAPLSFGVFMYFFAGSIFNRFFDSDDRVNENIDIRRVIAGVVSGVFMLFVEMILFVIRSHELDASVRKKGRRRENRANPFGYTEKSMARTYVRDD